MRPPNCVQSQTRTDQIRRDDKESWPTLLLKKIQSCTQENTVMYNLFVTSTNETTNSPIHQITNWNCCIKAWEPFTTLLHSRIISYLLLSKMFLALTFHFKDILEHFELVNWRIRNFFFDVTNKKIHKKQGESILQLHNSVTYWKSFLACFYLCFAFMKRIAPSDMISPLCELRVLPAKCLWF